MKMKPIGITPISECSDPFTCFHWHHPSDMMSFLRRTRSSDIKGELIHKAESLGFAKEPKVVEEIYADVGEEMIQELDPFQLLQNVKPLNLPQMKNKTPYQCKTCDKEFSNICGLRKHEATHLEVKDRPYPCAQCGKRFTQKDSRDLHVEIVHLKKTPYQCKTCDKEIRDICSLRKHEATHLEVRDRPYICSPAPQR